eukprot:gb/GECG01003126.1/.p1 GENE.gb/GECG01003126.1/~~gb/GECG01003126.1/.p1  ORF type:complete len:213 (+),score=23.67 gb/GECG01003126.1/:1-639(+)
MNNQVMKIGEYLLLALAFVFPIVSVATDEWTVRDVTRSGQDFVTNFGAFETCWSSLSECGDTEDVNGIDSDAVKATQAFAIIGLLITIPVVVICLLCDLKSVMPSSLSQFINNLLKFRKSAYYTVVCVAGAISFFLSFMTWIAVDQDVDDSDGGFSWAFMFLSALFVAVLGFIRYVDPSEAIPQVGKEDSEGAAAPRQPANQQTVEVEKSES